ncbi:MAG: hypothetical protein KAW17_07060 [Candidatus Eisenbacteria sp.]|nr:hypothetical protein [Candidatus Eisenbacteria bacterium]
MVIAIPIFGSRVSPRFDHAQELLLIKEAEGRVVESKRVIFGDSGPLERVARLAALHTNVVICGGISGFLARQLAFRGVRVYSWVTGEAEDALGCFLTGQLETGLMAGPRGPCGRWRLGRGGRGRGGHRGRRGPGG